MAVLKFKNPKYTGLDDEPKYIAIPNIKINEVYIGDSQPTGNESLWINTTDSSINYKNGEEWIKIDLSEYAKVIKIEDGGSGVVTKQLKPNTYYEFGECTSLTITLLEEISGVYSEYMFEFISGETATQLSLPETIGWIGGEIPTIEANKTYQCSIVNNIAVIGGK